MDENPDTITSLLTRDPAASILFAIAIFLIIFDASAIHVFSVSKHAGPLMTAMWLTGAFSIAGIVLGLMRGLQSGRAGKKPGA